MELTKPLHTAILVTDLEKSEQFYSQVLGLEAVERSLKFPGIWYQLGDYQIHLIVQPEYRFEPIAPDKWGRNQHIAFAVADLDAAKQQLSDRQIPFQMSASGRAALFTHDPDGNIIELSQA